MATRGTTGLRPGKVRQGAAQSTRDLGSVMREAISRGFVVGREVLVGQIPGIVVGYNIATFGTFTGASYPLVVRTALGVTKCGIDELTLV